MFKNKTELMEDVSNVFCRSNTVGKFAGLVEKYGCSDLPVLIMGEPGTGKDKTANSIYMNGKLSANPMVTVDCAVVGEKKWVHLLESEYSPFWEEGMSRSKTALRLQISRSTLWRMLGS